MMNMVWREVEFTLVWNHLNCDASENDKKITQRHNLTFSSAFLNSNIIWEIAIMVFMQIQTIKKEEKLQNLNEIVLHPY